MELFTPDAGLLFWMLLSFGVVFFVLAKWGFPVITRMVDDRKRFIDQSLEAAREANAKLEGIKAESEALLAQAREEQRRLNAELRATRALLAESTRINERTRISRELHDLLGHHLTALSLNLEVASHVTEGKAQELKGEAQQVAGTVKGKLGNKI